METTNSGITTNGAAKTTAITKSHHPLAEAIRAELKKLLDADDFEKNLVQIQGLATKARELLSVVNADSAVSNIVGPTGLPQVAPIYTGGQMLGASGIGGGIYEQFGAKILRELVATLPEAVRAFRESPAEIVRAISEARNHGLGKVADRLERRLFAEGGVLPEVDDVAQTVAAVANASQTPTPQEDPSQGAQAT